MNSTINSGRQQDHLSAVSWPQWGEEARSLVLEALYAGEWGTLGKKACDFAKEFARYCGVKYGIAVNNGTQALEIILRALKIGYGDEVIVPSYTFVASVAAIAYVGATPVFSDIDLNTGCVDAKSAQKCITDKTKALIAVHMCGRPCDMDELKELCDTNGITLIEDAAQAHGSEWNGRRTGSLGAASAFSFQSNKTLTSGEGGMILTDHEEIYRECWHYHNSGRALGSEVELGGEVLMGTNARMAEWEAAILAEQVKRLDEQNKQRNQNAQLLRQLLSKEPRFIFFKETPLITRNGQYMFAIKLDVDIEKRAKFMAIINSYGISVSGGYPPLHKSPLLRSETFIKSTGGMFDYSAVKLPHTEALCACAVWLPGTYLLAEEEAIMQIAAVYHKAISEIT